MSKANVTIDVFLSASRLDVGVAEVVRHSFEARGLTVFATYEQEPGGRIEEAIRSAMAESRVFVAILSRASMNSATLAVELGAALAWGKLIHLLLAGITPQELPAWLAHHPTASASELRRVIDEIDRAIEPLTAEQARILGELYASIGVASEKLASRPATLDQLTLRFNRRIGASFSPERILQELTRLRKRGALPKLNRRTG